MAGKSTTVANLHQSFSPLRRNGSAGRTGLATASKSPESAHAPSKSVVSLLQRQNLWHRHFCQADSIADRIIMPANSEALRLAFLWSFAFHRINFQNRV